MKCAWINLTSDDYNGVVAAARAGTEVTPHHSVAVQLFAQGAKAWARLGDRRQTEVALDKGRRLLESLPYPENVDHHFVVDPTKYDFYAMDCYRTLADDKMAENLAAEVIQASTDFDGRERPRCASQRQGSFSAWSKHGKATSTEQYSTGLRHWVATANRCRHSLWSAGISPRC